MWRIKVDIKIKNLKKYYKDKLILDIPSLNIDCNKITGIVGENGAGKTTLLNIIAGLDKNHEGEILYSGQTLNKNIQKKITLIFQKPRLLNRSVYKTIAYPMEIRKIKKNEKEKDINDILNKLDIFNLKDMNASKLSGGEQQKVSIARAMVFRPKILMLDEPTSNIDSNSIDIIERELLNYRKREKATVVIITHNKEQADKLCDNIITLNKI
jgi:tungstate transport system ATP-binding protein